MSDGFGFRVEVAHSSGSRAGVLTTPHGQVQTPLFMPVATLASVKGVDIARVAETGATMLLSNTYHLHLRPGEELVSGSGGVGHFMGWSGPTLTDSGGYQVFSLARQVKVTDHGAMFRSHLDGSQVDLTPEKAVAIQESLGADVAMQLDHVIGLPAERNDVAEAMERSLAWGERCLAARQKSDQAMFGIVQGGVLVLLAELLDDPRVGVRLQAGAEVLRAEEEEKAAEKVADEQEESQQLQDGQGG